MFGVLEPKDFCASRGMSRFRAGIFMLGLGLMGHVTLYVGSFKFRVGIWESLESEAVAV